MALIPDTPTMPKDFDFTSLHTVHLVPLTAYGPDGSLNRDAQAEHTAAMYAAGIAVLFLLFSATGHAASLLEEAESGTLDRILVSQAGLFQIICGKWLGIFIMGCLQITIMIRLR